MKKLILLFFILAFITLLPFQTNAFAGGAGTEGDPYQISTCLELQDMNTDLDAHYILTGDIDCSATTGWNAGAGFEPIGDSTTPFAGTLDGQGFVISDLFIDRDVIVIGLFDQTGDGAEISNVGLEELDFADGLSTGPARMGGLVGLNAGLISNSYSTGNIVINGIEAGGLVGNNTGTISNSYSKATVTNTDARAAGLVATNGSTITNSYSTGAVSGDTTGGLISINSGTITDSFWDTETSGQATSAGGTGKTTAEMKTLSIFTDADTAGLTTPWDFLGNPNDDEAGEDHWSIDAGVNAGYPFLTAFVNTVPGIPTALFATAISSTEVDLSWTAPEYDGDGTLTGYQIERKEGAGTYSTLVADTGTTDTTYSDTGLTAETLYTYKISAINTIGTSSASTEASDTTLETPATAPDAPTTLSATAVSSSQVDLSWTAPDNGGSVITGYKIERKTGDGAYSTLVADTGTTATTYSDTGLDDSNTYTYKISAINAVGTGSASAEASATTESESTSSGSSRIYAPSQAPSPETVEDDLSQEERDNFQTQIDHIRSIIELLMELIRERFGIVLTN